MNKRLAILFFSFTFFANQMFGWQSAGHKIVANIAYSLISKNCRDSVQAYLDTTSFEKAAVWMDEVRGNPNFNYLKPIHYINIEKDKTYVKVPDNNIINALDLAFATLKNRTHQTHANIRFQLLLLFHLIGDLHQPLHVGYGDDRGGNEIYLRFQNKKTNLHKLWDADLIKRSQIKLSDCLQLLKSLNNRDLQTYRQINIEQWMQESRAFLPQVYDFNNNTIDETYMLKNKPLIVSQLTKAGIRLAAILEFCFGR